MKINQKIIDAETRLHDAFSKIENIALYNQNKVLDAFKQNKIAANHFSGSTGYGDGDSGREKLCDLFASIFNCESALVSPHILCGTHAITIALFGLLNYGDTMISISGQPYDTLSKVIDGNEVGSLKEKGIVFKQISLRKGHLDTELIIEQIAKEKPKMAYLQRSKGYEFRDAINISEMSKIFPKIKELSPNTIIVVDNCYGEFTETKEPSDVGADIIIGSLTKNAGGGLAPNGGYIAGKECFVKKISYRFTSPSLGNNVGSFEAGYRMFFQGIFQAPQVVFQAMKGVLLAQELFSSTYNVFPKKDSTISDIVLAIKFNNKDNLIKLCQCIQHNSPIDSFVNLEPWNMPGYQDKVIMASGSFVEGATLELSCDAPMRDPYVAYLQGGLSYNHIKIALNDYLNNQQYN